MIEGKYNFENDLREFFKGKTVLVTGGTGSIGSEITRALKNTDVKVVRILSNDENGVFMLSKELGCEKYRFFVGDVRDKERLVMACEGVDIVFHAAALKHVPLCEYNPSEAVKTNVLGTLNLIEACLKQNVEKMIFISTDKAVASTSTMGASKFLAEKLVIDAKFYRGDKPTAFSIVRFGNVIGSRGSVIPIFVEQAMKGGPITLTDPEMTRFMMSPQEAIQLIFKAAFLANGGEIFTFQMPVVKMIEVAEVIREEVSNIKHQSSDNIEIKTIGLRQGERLYEALMSEEEATRAKKKGELLVIPPIDSDIFGMKAITNTSGLEEISEPYQSDMIEPISKEEIRDLLIRLKVLEQ